MRLKLVLAVAALLVFVGSSKAAYILEVDTDGMDDGVLTFHPNFSFGGDTTTASQSAASSAVGLTGGDSIFGGDGSALPDTYVYTYTPGVDGDNSALAAGTPLNSGGDVATGFTAGAAGPYNIYATWPFTSNVSGGDTAYELSDSGGVIFSTTIDQNGGGAGLGNEWVLIGSADLDPSETYTLTQQPTVSNSFVSMRSAAIMFDGGVPEPSTMALAALLVCSLGLSRRKR